MSDPEPLVPVALFLVSLALEAGELDLARISAELEELAAAYFSRCPPSTKA